jgi:hypothetical protein
MAEEDIKEIEFQGRTLKVRYPDWQQWVALREMEDIANISHAQYVHYRDQAGAAADAGEDTKDLTDKAVEAGLLTLDQARNLMKIFKGVLVQIIDYSWLVGRFASKETSEEDLADLLKLVMEAFGEEPVPASRQQRRARRTK